MRDVFRSASSAHSSNRQESRPLHDFTWPEAATRTCVIIDSDQELAGYPLYDYPLSTNYYLLFTIRLYGTQARCELNSNLIAEHSFHQFRRDPATHLISTKLNYLQARITKNRNPSKQATCNAFTWLPERYSLLPCTWCEINTSCQRKRARSQIAKEQNTEQILPQAIPTKMPQAV